MLLVWLYSEETDDTLKEKKWGDSKKNNIKNSY